MICKVKASIQGLESQKTRSVELMLTIVGNAGMSVARYRVFFSRVYMKIDSCCNYDLEAIN